MTKKKKKSPAASGKTTRKKTSPKKASSKKASKKTSPKKVSPKVSAKKVSKKAPKKAVSKKVARKKVAKKSAGNFNQTGPDTLQALWRNFPDLIFRLSTDGLILDYTAGEDMVLYTTPENFLGRELTSVLPEHVAGPTAEALAGARKTGAMTTMEYDLGGPEGRRYYEARLMPFGNEEIVCFVRDITRQKEAEERLNQREHLIRTILYNVPVILFATDNKGDFTFIDGKGLTDLAVKGDDILGENAFQAAAYSSQFVANIEKALQGESFTARVDDFADLVFEIYYSPLRGDDDQVNGVIGVASDITERSNLENQLRQSQKMEVAGRLAGGIAHDFNNLLTVIMLNTDTLLARHTIGDPTYNMIQVIDRAAERAATLTNRLLAFSRKQIVQPRVLELGKIFQELEGMLNQLIGEDIELSIGFGEGPFHVKADPGQIEQIFLNLAVNSRDAMPQGGRLAVKIENVYLSEEYARTLLDMEPGNYVMLAMSDTGHGMDKETVSHIFEPFFTTKEAGKGTGLGLSTVYGIVKQSKGHIDVSSEVGHGTIVQIYLPRAAEAEGDDVELAPPMPAPMGNETILLVEDQDDVRLSLRLILQRNKYTVLESREAEEAMVVCELHDGPIHLLITDVVLPGISGPELARMVNERRGDTQVLFISGYPDDAIEKHGLADAGMVMQKPFKPQQLVQTVREIFDNAAPE